MMFSKKIVVYDLTHGVLYHWKYYVTAAVVFISFFLMHFFQIRIFAITHNNLDMTSTLADYIMSVLGGAAPLDFANPTFFQAPVIWISFYLWYLFLVLSYPFNELQGIGKHILVLSHKKKYWWYSKTIWLLVTAFLYMGVFLLIAFSTSLILGARPSMYVEQYVIRNLGYAQIELVDAPWSISINLLLVLLTLFSIGIFETVLSLIIKPVFSFIFSISVIILSAYIDSPFLFPNFGMICRTEKILKGGLPISLGVLAMLVGSVFCFFLGWLIFLNTDILREERRTI